MRTLLFTELLSGNSNVLLDLPWQSYIFFIMATIVVCPAAPFAYTLIPAHNVILFPKYWYEYSIQGSTWAILLGLTLTHGAGCRMNIVYIHSPHHYLRSVIAGTVTANSIACIFIYIWTQVLHFHLPVPFIAYVAAYSTLCACYAAIWFSFPIDWRNDKRFRRRLKFWICQILFDMFIVIFYNVATAILRKYQNDYQVAAALMFVFLRELNAVSYTHLTLPTNREV